MKTKASFAAESVRLRQWNQQIRECQNCPAGLTMDDWCRQQGHGSRITPPAQQEEKALPWKPDPEYHSRLSFSGGLPSCKKYWDGSHALCTTGNS